MTDTRPDTQRPTPPRQDRRRWLGLATAALLQPAFPLLAATPLPSPTGSNLSAAGRPPRLAAAWEGDGAYRVGVVQPEGQTMRVLSTVEVPTRAHGLWVEADGSLLAVARRPGDWMLRWRPDGEVIAWAWSEPGRAFNGHALSSTDGKTLYTTETDLEFSTGLIGVRDARTLEKRAEWPTHGMDPHQLLWDQAGRLVVANGGIPTRPETGRLKLDLDRMDSSLVQLAPQDGRLLGQWRLPDKRLSLRHLARIGPHIGIALQAEHDDPQVKAAAPVLAVFNGSQLQLGSSQHPRAGYGGDISAVGGLFVVSCPRSNGVALYQPDGRDAGWQALDEACALAPAAGSLWVGGREEALQVPARRAAAPDAGQLLAAPTLRLDNHWVPLGGA